MLQLQVGKKYLDRQGAVVEITKEYPGSAYPFIGNDCELNVQSFTGEGRFFSQPGYESQYDLVALYEDPPPPAPPQYPLWDLLRATWKGGSLLPKASLERKSFPVWSGFDCYFPAAIVAVAGWSKTANEKHNPGEPLQHARGKSGDHQDCQRRHALDSADPSCDKLEELTCKAWRALAELQEYAETLGAPAAPAATFPVKEEAK